MSKSSRGRDSVICAMEPNSFRPMLVTIFGDYTLAYLSSTSRENYLALWGPESHMGVTTELSVEDAKVRRAVHTYFAVSWNSYVVIF